ncbi:hypothetical protein HDU93_000490, partial [Gonapodya sp. JEL0774]
IDVCLFADHVGVPATDTLDVSEGVHDLAATIDVLDRGRRSGETEGNENTHGVEKTENVLELRLVGENESLDRSDARWVEEGREGHSKWKKKPTVSQLRNTRDDRTRDSAVVEMCNCPGPSYRLVIDNTSDQRRLEVPVSPLLPFFFFIISLSSSRFVLSVLSVSVPSPGPSPLSTSIHHFPHSTHPIHRSFSLPLSPSLSAFLSPSSSPALLTIFAVSLLVCPSLWSHSYNHKPCTRHHTLSLPLVESLPKLETVCFKEYLPILPTKAGKEKLEFILGHRELPITFDFRWSTVNRKDVADEEHDVSMWTDQTLGGNAPLLEGQSVEWKCNLSAGYSKVYDSEQRMEEDEESEGYQTDEDEEEGEEDEEEEEEEESD